MLLAKKPKLVQSNSSVTLLTFFPPREMLAVTERKEGTDSLQVLKSPWICYFSLLGRNTTGLMQGPHKSCVQERKAEINTAPKHSELQRAKQGSLSNHTADLQLSEEVLQQYKSRGKHKTTLNFITLL